MVSFFHLNVYWFYNFCISYYKGKVDLEEMISAFKDLGVDIEKREALKLLQR